MKNLCSYCLFGDYPGYSNYLPGLVRAHHAAFPDWTLRMYHDNHTMTMPWGELLRAYEREGLMQLTYAGEESFEVCRSMLWRMKACWDPEAGYVLCRDVDSMPSFRERRCVEEFIESGASTHCINDEPGHTAVMMGGMVGFNAPLFRIVMGPHFKSWEELIATGQNLGNRHDGPDQKLLFYNVWPHVRATVCEHRIKGCPRQPHVQASYHRVPAKTLEWINQDLVRNRFDSDNDDLCCYIGAAGYNVKEVVRLFDQFGDQELVGRIRKAEAQ